MYPQTNLHICCICFVFLVLGGEPPGEGEETAELPDMMEEADNEGGDEKTGEDKEDNENEKNDGDKEENEGQKEEENSEQEKNEETSAAEEEKMETVRIQNKRMCVCVSEWGEVVGQREGGGEGGGDRWICDCNLGNG